MLILAQFFSFIGALFVAISIFSKSKKHMIICQLGTTFFCTITNIILKGYSGIIANLLLSIRHFLEIKGYLTKKVTIIICLILIPSGLYFNCNGYFGLLPVTAATIFIWFTYVIKSVQNMRLLIALTHFQWAFYDFYIRSYPIFVLDVIIISTSLWKYFKVKSIEKASE